MARMNLKSAQGVPSGRSEAILIRTTVAGHALFEDHYLVTVFLYFLLILSSTKFYTIITFLTSTLGKILLHFK